MSNDDYTPEWGTTVAQLRNDGKIQCTACGVYVSRQEATVFEQIQPDGEDKTVVHCTGCGQ